MTSEEYALQMAWALERTYEKGLFDGRNEASQKERATYDKGFDEGFAAGRNEGYSYGLDQGLEEGYEDGYDEGYEDGEQDKAGA